VRLLVDTHSFVWFIAGHSALSGRARRAIESSRNEKYFSIASVWEMAIKHGLGKLRLEVPLRAAVQAGMEACAASLLGLDSEHALAIADLPYHHDDPFDRLLITQAQAEELRIVSRDEAFDDYGIRRIW
jgi:PIN domain nuclease of toxin-antitoxin system